MSRPLRIEYEGAWYHVMNRGRRSDRIFVGPDDYRLFIDLLKEAIELWNIQISAYCLMSNHYHLLIHTPQGNLSRCMRHINAVYTQRFNRAHGFDGQLFRGRFKAIVVHGDEYLLQLVRYIHRNPLRAGIVDRLGEYQWSSHNGYLSPDGKWDWLYKDFILSILSARKEHRLQAYQRFIMIDDSQELAEKLAQTKWPGFLGNESFEKWLRKTFFQQKRHSQIPDSVALAPELDTIKNAVCSYYRVDESELLTSKRGRFSEPRSMAIYLARMLRNDGLLRIGAEFSLSGYSSTGSVVDGMKKQLKKDRKLRERYEEIKGACLISQTET